MQAPPQETKTPLPGMGCLPFEGGVAFRVWAPHAKAVRVEGQDAAGQQWSQKLNREPHDTWYGESADAGIGDQYQYVLDCGDREIRRMDPYAREVTNSVGSSIIHDHEFDWEDDDFVMPNMNELVVYELHVGTFHRTSPDQPGGFDQVAEKLRYLKKLGVNAIELMPLAEFAGDISWGYNPAQIYAVESAYGGPMGLKNLVKEAHRHGIGVILDVVYNHFGPSDLDLWQFDGWSEGDKGGIYFYQDWRSDTPWGATRPDYGRGEVRTFIHDNAMMWLRDYHMDGLRFDMTLYMRSVDGNPDTDLADGWSLAQWINRDVHHEFPRAVTIAEDLRNNNWLTRREPEGGAGFSSQWDAEFVHPVRAAVTVINDADRSMESIKDALCHRYNLGAFERVIYSESHDEVANGKQRVPSEVDPNDPTGWFAQKRSILAAGLVFTGRGIPMIFQGQEFLRFGWFDDSRGVDWKQRDDFRGIVRLYHDLIQLRLNRTGVTKGLMGDHIEVNHLHDENKVIAFRRWMDGGEGDDVLIVVNFANRHWDDYRVGFVRGGTWHVRFNSDSEHYSEIFDNTPQEQVVPEEEGYDFLPFSGSLRLAPYSMLILSEDPRPTTT